MASENEKIRTRFAPSPTGFLHIGGLRTALYSYLFAKQKGGQFILRLEDTDIKRQVEGAAKKIYRGLKWAGLRYDEGPDSGGPFGPYVQSQRTDIYKKYASQLLEKGSAYRCFCEEETLEKMRREQIAKKQPPKYDRRCLNLTEKEIKENLAGGRPYVIRMKIPENRIIEFEDMVRGKISCKSSELDDQVLLKSDGYPTYHLAVVVDDYLMKISHVTRTEEWLSSTPKHLLLYEYFGWEPPKFAHLPLLLNTDKTKMSKRKGDVALDYYIQKGFLAEAMINFLAFLGWNPGTEKEIYSMEELLKDFSLEKVHKAGAIFNLEKLIWYNQYYIRQLDLDKLTEMCLPHLEKTDSNESADFNYFKKIIALEQERMKYLSEAGERTKFFFEEPEYEKELLIWKSTPEEKIKSALKKLCDIIENIPESDFSKENLQSEIMPEAENLATLSPGKALHDRGIMLWPFRAALSGQKASPGPFEIAEILGKKKTLERIKKAIEKLK